jgi:hypothetical protein
MKKSLFLFCFFLCYLLSAKAQYAAKENATDKPVGVENIRNARWLSGSWGIWYQLYGGAVLDRGPDYDYVAGAQDIVDNLPTMGHVMSSLTYSAHGQYFLLRDNAYVDVANEIHPDLVPSPENEQIILDVIDTFRKAGKKVMLYIAADGPSKKAVAEDIRTAWIRYYNTKFDGNEGLAYRTLIRGYVERLKGRVDGYWLDGGIPGGEADFVSMLREVDSTLSITLNFGKIYFENADGTLIYVDTDGFNDENEADYSIVRHTITDGYMDYTSGHVTPLALGAPPNSWAYEEFTFPDMLAAPWESYNGSKDVLKHAFHPMRQRWSVSKTELVFKDVDQAYRFVRTITDGDCGFTWATTTDNKGFMMRDEMDILKEINNRMAMSPMPDYIPYRRPAGAYLVGEKRSHAVLDSGNIWYHNHTPGAFNASISRITQGSLETGQNSPYTQGNASALVSKFARDSGNNAAIKFILPGMLNGSSSATFKIRVYAGADKTMTNSTLKMILRKDGDSTKQVGLTKEITAFNEWVEYCFDMSGLTFTEDHYNEIYLFFASEDSDDDANGNVYYLDAFQGPQGRLKTTGIK